MTATQTVFRYETLLFHTLMHNILSLTLTYRNKPVSHLHCNIHVLATIFT